MRCAGRRRLESAGHLATMQLLPKAHLASFNFAPAGSVLLPADVTPAMQQWLVRAGWHWAQPPEALPGQVGQAGTNGAP